MGEAQADEARVSKGVAGFAFLGLVMGALITTGNFPGIPNQNHANERKGEKVALIVQSYDYRADIMIPHLNRDETVTLRKQGDDERNRWQETIIAVKGQEITLIASQRGEDQVTCTIVQGSIESPRYQRTHRTSQDGLYKLGSAYCNITVK
jgi:hypothetical protein